MTSDEQAIRQLIADWVTFTQEGRIDELMDLMTDDVVFLTVVNPPMSRAQFEQASRGMVGNVTLKVESDIQEIRLEGNFAWLWQYLTVKVAPSGKDTITKQGKTMGLYRKCNDNKWRLMRDANMMP